VNPRLIPVLQISGSQLIKVEQFKKRRYVGDPVNAARIFSDKLANEIIILDIDASRENLEPNFELIEEISTECFMPVTYGGGISNIGIAEKIFELGIDKICVNKMFLQNPSTLKSIVSNYGSQAVAVSLDIKMRDTIEFDVFEYWTGNVSSISASSAIELLRELNIGEVIINIVDLDGTFEGPNIEIVEYLSRLIDIPVVYMGGISNLDEVKLVVSQGAHSVGAGSMLIFQGINRAVMINYPKEIELEKLFYDN
jgi:cyclase